MIPAINVMNLNFRYEDGTEALREISFHVRENETVGIIGPNGAGKSTLLLHLNGLLPEVKTEPSSVSIFSEGITDISESSIRRSVGLLFQNPDDQLFCPTVYEDVAFGPQQFGFDGKSVREIVRGALKEVGLEGYENRLPHHLSGGEKQRVCLAGVLACQPKILALDEPTKELDPRGRRTLIEFLKKKMITLIIATHDLEMIVELCNRTIILDSGKLVADGLTLELLADDRLMMEHGLEKPHSLQHRHPHR
jgi:energy-coupling factor transporter ATP-binding protein EcfA2